MGVFIKDTSNIFSGLNKTITTLVATDSILIPHNIVIDNIIVFNLKMDSIRLNLQKFRTSTSNTTMNYTKYLEVKGYQTVDLIGLLNLSGLKLYYQLNPNIVDSLVCFSDNVTQTFDCEVNYSILNETGFF